MHILFAQFFVLSKLTHPTAGLLVCCERFPFQKKILLFYFPCFRNNDWIWSPTPSNTAKYYPPRSKSAWDQSVILLSMSQGTDRNSKAQQAYSSRSEPAYVMGKAGLTPVRCGLCTARFYPVFEHFCRNPMDFFESTLKMQYAGFFGMLSEIAAKTCNPHRRLWDCG